MLFRAGVADWRRRAHSLPCRYRDPDRRTDAHLLACDGKGLGQAQDDRIGDSRQLFGLAHLRHDDLELVDAEAPDLSLVADDLRQPPRDMLQQLVADGMPQRVVDRKSTRLNSSN